MILVKFRPKEWFVSIEDKATKAQFWCKFYKSGRYLSKVDLIEWGTNVEKVIGNIKVQKEMSINRFFKSDLFRELMLQAGYKE